MKVLLAACCFAAVSAKLSLPSFYGSSMVFKHKEPFTIWGTETAGANVTVALFSKTHSATAGSDGKWTASLPAQPTMMTPTTISITSASDKIELTDVVFGEVYVCGGQSNMELPIMATLNASQEVHNGGIYGPGLRIMQVNKNLDYYNVTAPQENLSTSITWGRAVNQFVPAAPGQVHHTIEGMSAFCFYYGASLTKANPSIPIGLIASSW
jgi:sialate O-acetylesterase